LPVAAILATMDRAGREGVSMANEKHVALLKQRVEVWNKWREENPDVPDLSDEVLDLNLSGVNLSDTILCNVELARADLSGADLSGADLRGANLYDADLSNAFLSGADLRGTILYDADLRDADLRDADLRGAYLSFADLRDADLRGADLNDAILFGANLSGTNLTKSKLDADLQRASLIDSCLDGANLTGAKLWKTQRAGWSIKGIICQSAFWDKEGEDLQEYEDGAFERIFAEKARIVLRYPGGMSPVDLAMLPLIVERLQVEHPDCALHIRSVQDDGNDAVVTITVDDRTGRQDDVFKKKLVQLQVRLECVTEERDYLRQRQERWFLEASSKIQDLVRLPTQEIHLHRPSGRVTIEGIAMNTGDTNINHGQAGVIGRDGHAHDMTFQQVQNQGALDLPRLAEELARLRAAMKQETAGTAEQDEAIGAVAAAGKAAGQGDDRTMLRHLKAAGTWTLGIAEKIGVAVAAEAIKRAM
jgi:uncharacterized protein YjbI with pentapeptide repeats